MEMKEFDDALKTFDKVKEIEPSLAEGAFPSARSPLAASSSAPCAEVDDKIHQTQVLAKRAKRKDYYKILGALPHSQPLPPSSAHGSAQRSPRARTTTRSRRRTEKWRSSGTRVRRRPPARAQGVAD